MGSSSVTPASSSASRHCRTLSTPISCRRWRKASFRDSRLPAISCVTSGASPTRPVRSPIDKIYPALIALISRASSDSVVTLLQNIVVTGRGSQVKGIDTVLPAASRRRRLRNAQSQTGRQGLQTLGRDGCPESRPLRPRKSMAGSAALIDFIQQSRPRRSEALHGIGRPHLPWRATVPRGRDCASRAATPRHEHCMSITAKNPKIPAATDRGPTAREKKTPRQFTDG